MDVSSLSRQMVFHLYPSNYSSAFAFSNVPNSHSQYALRCVFPFRERYEVSTFHLVKFTNLGVCFRPRIYGTAWSEEPSDSLYPVAFWLKCNSHFHLFKLTIFMQIHICSPCSLPSAYLSMADREILSSRILSQAVPFATLLSSLLYSEL